MSASPSSPLSFHLSPTSPASPPTNLSEHPEPCHHKKRRFQARERRRQRERNVSFQHESIFSSSADTNEKVGKRGTRMEGQVYFWVNERVRESERRRERERKRTDRYMTGFAMKNGELGWLGKPKIRDLLIFQWYCHSGSFQVSWFLNYYFEFVSCLDTTSHKHFSPRDFSNSCMCVLFWTEMCFETDFWSARMFWWF